jgi:hypothetical protein
METGSGTLSPLPDVLARGLIPVATLGFLSFFCSTSLFVYLTYRLLSWRQKYGLRTPINQFLFLIYNLVFAGKKNLNDSGPTSNKNLQISNKRRDSSSTLEL